MTKLRMDPVLVELARLLTDVDVVAPLVPPAAQSAAQAGDDQVDVRQATRLARIAADDVVDTVLGMWDLLAPGCPAPERVRLEWFTRETESGTVALPEAAATARTSVAPDLVEESCRYLRARGWLVSLDELPGGQRVLARQGHVYVEVQVRSLMGLVILRARTAPLLLGQVGTDLHRLGAQLRTWR